MRNLVNQITGSVTQCVIMLKLDGKFHFQCIEKPKSAVPTFMLAVK